jgi:hypothetical protein
MGKCSMGKSVRPKMLVACRCRGPGDQLALAKATRDQEPILHQPILGGRSEGRVEDGMPLTASAAKLLRAASGMGVLQPRG